LVVACSIFFYLLTSLLVTSFSFFNSLILLSYLYRVVIFHTSLISLFLRLNLFIPPFISLSSFPSIYYFFISSRPLSLISIYLFFHLFIYLLSLLFDYFFISSRPISLILIYLLLHLSILFPFYLLFLYSFSLFLWSQFIYSFVYLSIFFPFYFIISLFLLALFLPSQFIYCSIYLSSFPSIYYFLISSWHLSLISFLYSVYLSVFFPLYFLFLYCHSVIW
jgi:hypothetical protein